MTATMSCTTFAVTGVGSTTMKFFFDDATANVSKIMTILALMGLGITGTKVFLNEGGKKYDHDDPFVRARRRHDHSVGIPFVLVVIMTVVGMMFLTLLMSAGRGVKVPGFRKAAKTVTFDPRFDYVPALIQFTVYLNAIRQGMAGEELDDYGEQVHVDTTCAYSA